MDIIVIGFRESWIKVDPCMFGYIEIANFGIKINGQPVTNCDRLTKTSDPRFVLYFFAEHDAVTATDVFITPSPAGPYLAFYPLWNASEKAGKIGLMDSCHEKRKKY